MRTELEITTELSSCIEEYRANVDVWNRLQVAESNSKVKALQQELNDLYTEGAGISPTLSRFIIGGIQGMKRTINGAEVYEVGCTIKVDIMGMPSSQGLCSRGNSIEQAVSNWNNGIYVVKY